MSIEMNNPKSLKEKIDALTNLIEQMYLSHTVHDEIKFTTAHKKAADLGFEIMQIVEESQ